MTERINSQGQLSSLRSEHGTTTIQDAVVSRVAGIAAQEVERSRWAAAPRPQSEGSCRV